MKSGLFYGNIDMVNGLIKRLKRITGRKTRVIATGGFAKFISRYIEEIDKIDLNLVLEGMIETARMED